MPKKGKKGKGKGKKGQNVKIFGRVRNLMPWEPRKTSLQVCPGNKLRNKTDKTTNEYSFNKVFGIDINNSEIYDSMVMPMIDNVLSGFNAVLIAYGQTGSGKTFTMLGKPKLGVKGLLPRTLEQFVNTDSVYKLELAAVEAFGHHVAKIELFDLYLPHNQTPVWNDKKGDTGQEMHRAIRKEVTDIDSAYTLIRYAHSASHFAPTGKNPESSRGHVTFVSRVVQENDHSQLISYFVMVDCAGSEGESAFTPNFRKSVDAATLMARRLEAGCINTGLSQLQIIFNELRVKGKLSNAIGNGLRRALHPYINTRTFLSVLFCLSPSVTNCRATEATLKFAVTAGMVKVTPLASKKVIDFKAVIKELRDHIAEQEEVIERNNDRLEQVQLELNVIKQDIIEAHERQQRMAAKKKESNVTFNIQVVEQEIEESDGQQHAVSPSEKRQSRHHTLTLTQTERMGSRIISLAIEPHIRVKSELPAALEMKFAALEKEEEDEAAALYNPMMDEYGDTVSSIDRVKKAMEKDDAHKVVDVEQNTHEMELALFRHSKLHQKMQTVTQLAKDFNLSALMEEEVNADHEQKDEESMSEKVYDSEYSRLKAVDYKKISKEELSAYAGDLKLYQQQETVITKQLQQSCNVITDYLQDEFEGLLSFFRVKKILPKQRIDIQW